MFSQVRPQGRSLTVGITISCGMAFMLFGYDQGVFGGILSCQSFETTFNNPNTTVQGQMTSSYVLGCVFGAALAMFTGNILGRRRSIALACCFCLVGGILQATSSTLPHLIIGRIVAGLGVGINTTTVPMWQSETCKPEHRGKLVALQLTHLVMGYVLANWINFGFTYIPTQSVSWRFPLAFQCVLALATAVWLPFMVESPRWLCLRGHPVSEIRGVIARLLDRPLEDEQVSRMLQSIQSMVTHEAESQSAGIREIFHNGPQQTFRRILLGAGVNFMQQFGGVNVVAYYLPVVLKRSFGFSDRLALILSAVDSMQWMFWTGMSSLVIERIGRRRLLIFGAAGQSLCFAMAALGLGINTKALNGVAVAFLFLYYFFFVSQALLPPSLPSACTLRILSYTDLLTRGSPSSPFPSCIHQRSTRIAPATWEARLQWWSTGAEST